MTTDEASPAASPLRGRILEAAFCSFTERGYAGTSTLEIARRAHVSKRDLYAAFGSKQAMLAACVAERAARMRLPLELPEPRSREALDATLLAFGRTMLTEVVRPEVLAVYRLAILEAERAPEVARTLDEVGRTTNQVALVELLAAAQANGLLGPGEPDEIADLFTATLWRGGLLVRLLLRVAEPPDAAEIERRARFATEALILLYPRRAKRAGGGA